jgi:hypothetical protein
VEILAEAGYGEGEIDAMRAAGATHQHDAVGVIDPSVARNGSTVRRD